MRTSKRKPTEQYQSVPTIQTRKLPSTPEQIRQRAYDIYVAHGGAEGMALNDWLEAEQELKRQLEDDNTSPQPNPFKVKIRRWRRVWFSPAVRLGPTNPLFKDFNETLTATEENYGTLEFSSTGSYEH